MPKVTVHISLDEKVVQIAREKKESEGFCLSRHVDAYLRSKFGLAGKKG